MASLLRFGASIVAKVTRDRLMACMGGGASRLRLLSATGLQRAGTLLRARPARADGASSRSSAVALALGALTADADEAAPDVLPL